MLAASTVACLGFGPFATAAWADTGDPLAYYGGPVVHSENTVLVDWGAHVNPIFTNATTGDPGLLKFFAAESGSTADDGAVLAQYMDSTGQNAANRESYGGQFAITPTVAGTSVSDAQVASQLVAQIGSGALPTPAGNGLSTVYLVVFPPGTTICDDQGCSGQAFCSYHGSAALPNGTAVLYDVLPDDTSGPMTQGCGVSTALRNQTMYLSHELSESITDPLVDDATSYGPPLAWYDANCPNASSACGEVADKCNQQTTTEGGWTVQLMWSNLDGACVGSEPRYVAPSVSFSGPQSISPGAAASFLANAGDPPGNTASASWNGQSYAIPSGIASLSWNWGDGTPPSSGVSPVHTFASPGIYTISVTATDDLGFTASTTQQVAVWGPLGQPTAQTGVAAGIGRTTATLGGTIDPAGLSASYRFDYGRSGATLDSSTPATTIASGVSSAPVKAALRGLAAGRRYYYRLDAIVDGQTLPGTVASFTTTAAAAASTRSGGVARTAAAGSHSRKRSKATRKAKRAKRGTGGKRGKAGKRAKSSTGRKGKTRTAHVRVALSFAAARVESARVGAARVGAARVAQTSAVVLGGQTLAGELRHGLRVSFHCVRACHVSLDATLSLPGKLGLVAVPRVLASGSGRLAGAQAPRRASATATLQFSSSARAWLSKLRSAKFVVSAFQRLQ